MPLTFDELVAARERGMQSAAVILLITAAFGSFAWLVSGVGHPASAVVDLILGTLLYRGVDHFRPIVLVRAGIGLFIGTMTFLGGYSGTTTVLFGVVVGGGQILYCVSLFLLLFDTPTPGRVLLGQVFFAVSILMTAASIWVMEFGPPPIQV